MQQDETKQILWVDVKKLIPYARNARTHSDAQIAQIAGSIREFKFVNPVLLDKDFGIIAGHGRVLAARKLGLERVPCLMIEHLSETQKRAYILADNAIALNADWDEALLKIELEELKLADFDLDLIGFDSWTLDEILNSLDEGGADTEKERPLIIRGASLKDLAPTDEERSILEGKRFLVEFSGGKDSSAATIWLKTYFPESQVELCFVDMGADFIGFHLFLESFAAFVGYPLRILRSDRTMFEAFLRKGDWPIFIHPYCHDILHDTLDAFFEKHAPDEVVIVRGGRLAEKAASAKVQDSRFLTIDRLKEYRFFQPLYFGAKDVSEKVLEEVGAPLWQGYRYGLQRTACRICPGQKPLAYAAIRVNYPEVWAELLFFEEKFGPGCWQRREEGEALSFDALADKGGESFREAGYERLVQETPF